MSLLRRGAVLAVCSSLLVLPACGGGGGGGGTNPGPPPVVQTPTPSPAPSTAPPQQTASLTAGQPASASFPAVSNGVAGGVSVPAASSGAGTAIQAALNAALPAGTPQLSGLRRRPKAIGAGGLLGLGYVSLTPAANVAFGATPGFTFSLAAGPGMLTIAAPTPAYVAAYDPTNAAAGWQPILGPQTIGGGVTSVSFAGAPTPTALAAGTTYVYALFTAAGAVTVPTPRPTPTAIPTPVVTPTPVASPSPSPVASQQALPATGPMPVLGSGFGGTTAGTASAATVVAVGTHLTGSSAAPVLTQGSLTLTVNGKTSALRRSPRGGAPLAQLAVDAPTALQYAVVRHLLRGASRVTTVQGAVRRTRSLPTTTGATAGLWAQNAAIGSSSGGHYTQVPATLAAVTAHAYVWIDSTLISGGQVTTGRAQQIGANFENAWASDTQHFGTNVYAGLPVESDQASYCNAAGTKTGVGSAIIPSDPHTVVFVINPASLGGGVGGYFDPANYLPDAELQCSAQARAAGLHSNEAPMIYLGWFDQNDGGTYELQEDLVRGPAHEFQHLINFVDHALLNNDPSSFEDSFINEGLSMLAQDLALPRLFPSLTHDSLDAVRHANLWLGSPQSYSLTGFSGIDPNKSAAAYNCSGCYGGSFLFQRYLYDRFGGDTYLHAVESGTSTGLAHLGAITGEPGPQLLTEFGIALAANSANGSAPASGPYAMPGVPFGSALATQLGGSITVAPVGIVNAGAPGGGTFSGPYDGGYAFLAVPAAGASISLVDGSNAIGLAAGIAQR